MKHSMCIVFVTVIGAVLSGKPVQNQKCGENEVFRTCGARCPETCENRNVFPKVCYLVCARGCFCLRGYVRNEDQKCVKPRHCPKTTPKDKNSVITAPDTTADNKNPDEE